MGDAHLDEAAVALVLAQGKPECGTRLIRLVPGKAEALAGHVADNSASEGFLD
jgi:hypothetical protein